MPPSVMPSFIGKSAFLPEIAAKQASAFVTVKPLIQCSWFVQTGLRAIVGYVRRPQRTKMGCWSTVTGFSLLYFLYKYV